MSRYVFVVLATAAVCAGIARPAAAQQTLNLNIGYFAVRGEDSRIDDDVLLANLDVLSFEVSDFNNLTIGAEYLAGLGEYLEAGVGASFYTRTVPTVYRDLLRGDGTEIEQELKLRIIPLTGTIRVLPLGHSNPVQPYVGGGVALYNWRYVETGDFVDLSDLIFNETFEATGHDVGPVFLAGIRGVSSQFVIGGEFRFQMGNGHVGTENGFFTDRIDLGGYTAQATIGVRF